MKYKYILMCICIILCCVLFVQTTFAYLLTNITNKDNVITSASLSYEITAYQSSDQSLSTSDTLVNLSTDKDDPTVITEANLLFEFTNTGEGDLEIYCEVLDVSETSNYLEQQSFTISSGKTDSTTCKVNNLTSSDEYVYEIKVVYEYASSDITVDGNSTSYDSYYFKYYVEPTTNGLLGSYLEGNSGGDGTNDDESDVDGADGTDDGETNSDPDIEEESSEDEADGNDADGNDTDEEDTGDDDSEENQDEDEAQLPEEP